MSQSNLLHESDWDNLIILDACRYDMFKRFYQGFLTGKLVEVKTNSSCTEEWLAKNWRGWYDLTYVSGNPYVNSAGVPLRRYDGDGDVNGYVARDHFKKIVDVWKFGWDSELKTVTPKAMNNAVVKFTDGSNLIIHYVQPHWPYIGETKYTTGDGRRLRNNVQKGFFSKKKLTEITPKKRMKSREDVIRQRKAYIDNLLVALRGVQRLLPYLKGKTVVSADHGELLGEGGFFDHPCLFDHPLLKAVPWLTVEGEL